MLTNTYSTFKGKLKINYLLSLLILISVLFCGAFVTETAVLGSESESGERESEQTEEEWGIGFGMRSASIVFNNENGRVNSLTPLFYYKKNRFYLDGLEGGYHLYKNDPWQFTLFGRLRFFDIPEEYQNLVQGDTFDLGGRLSYLFDGRSHADLEMLTDSRGNFSAIARLGKSFESDRLDWSPYMEIRYKSSGFNDRYYALTWLDRESIDSGVDYLAGVKLRYHVVNNLYLLGSAKLRYLDGSARHAELVTSNLESEYFLGFGFFNDKKKKNKKDIGIKPYIRVAHGWATPTNLKHILYGNFDRDEYNHQLTSVFYGHPLSKTLFTLPIEMYLTSGFAYHYSSAVQDDSQEFVLAFKAYYTINWPIRFRIGVAEGMSYINSVTYIERENMDSKGYEPSKLMNYLDFSYEINIGDIFRKNSLKDTWLGFSIHHRSSIFETAQQFGRISGGSNYPSVHILHHF